MLFSARREARGAGRQALGANPKARDYGTTRPEPVDFRGPQF